MDFKLVEAQTTNECDEDDYTSEDETYDDIHENKKQPIMSTVDRKRENKTVECPNCHRKMNKKTLRYSHKCPTIKTKPKKEEIETEPEQPPQEQNVYHRLLELEFQRKEQLMKEKEEKMNKLITHAF